MAWIHYAIIHCNYENAKSFFCDLLKNFGQNYAYFYDFVMVINLVSHFVRLQLHEKAKHLAIASKIA